MIRLMCGIMVLMLNCSFSSMAFAISDFDFQNLVEEHSSVMLITEPETGKIVFANKAAKSYYGYDNILDMTIQQLTAMTPEEIERENLSASNEERYYLVYDHRLANGDIRKVELYIYSFNSGGNNLLFSVIHDVTEKFRLAAITQLQVRNYYLMISALVILLVVLILLSFLFLWRSRVQRSRIQEAEKKISTIVSNIRGMVFRCRNDEQWTMEYLSDGVVELTGYSHDEMIYNRHIDYNSIVDKEYRQRIRDVWNFRSLGLKRIYEDEYAIIAKDGSRKWVLDRGQAVYDQEGKIEFIEGIITDISDIKASERKAEEFREKLYATIHSAGDAIIATDKHLKIELMNPEAERITGWSKEIAVGKDLAAIFCIINEFTRERQSYTSEQALAECRVVHVTRGTILISKDGTEYPIDGSASPIWSSNGEVLGCVFVFRDNTEKFKREKELEFVSFHDYLTGLYNRRFFEEELKRLDNSRNLPITIMLIDADGLKIINDNYGHAAGDELIETIARVLKNVCRQNDIIARYGGDEFVVLLLNSNDEVAESIAERIEFSMRNCEIRGIKLSVSIGWDTKTSLNEAMSDILRNAENRMYERKRFSRNDSRRTNTDNANEAYNSRTFVDIDNDNI